MPVILSGKDCILSSETGSGKTLAYLLPILQKIDATSKNVQALIIAPTHELATQVFKQTEILNKNCDKQVRTALIVGGANIKKQIEKLKEKPNIIIGSMGRILELIRLKKITGHYIKTIVVDEADRMLDDTNIQDLESIIKTTLKDRNIIMVSASMLEKDIDKAKKIMNSPEIVQANTPEELPSSIEHMFFIAERRDKIDIIRKLMHADKVAKCILFINDPDEVDNLSKRLNYHALKSVVLHGIKKSEERKASLQSFKNGTSRILVASDIAARGLDIQGATHVINFDVPEEGVFYLHRAGRVGRMGNKGYSITIIEKRERNFITKLESKFKIKIEEKVMRKGEIINNKDSQISSKKNDFKDSRKSL